MCMLARCLRQLVSTLRPSGFACQHGGCAAFQHFSNGLHTRKAEVLNCEAGLPVIFLVAVYFCCAVELFEEDDPGEGMWEGDAAKGPEFVGSP